MAGLGSPLTLAKGCFAFTWIHFLAIVLVTNEWNFTNMWHHKWWFTNFIDFFLRRCSTFDWVVGEASKQWRNPTNQIGRITKSASERFLECCAWSVRTRLWNGRHTRFSGCARISNGQSNGGRIRCKRRSRASACRRIAENWRRARLQCDGRQRAKFANLHFTHYSRWCCRPSWRTETGRSIAFRQWSGKRFSSLHAIALIKM